MICQAVKRVTSPDDSSDQEGQSRGSDSSSQQSHLRDADDGEVVDTDEDADLSGKDGTTLKGIFESEVSFKTVFAFNTA